MSRCPHGYGGDGRCPDCDVERIEELEDKLADYDHDLLSRVDPDAAGSTDCYTWMRSKVAEIEDLGVADCRRLDRIKTLTRERDDARSALQTLYEYASSHLDCEEPAMRIAQRELDEANNEGTR